MIPHLQVSSRKQVTLHPSSVLFHTRPNYVVYNELVQTTKCYMRWSDHYRECNVDSFCLILHLLLVPLQQSTEFWPGIHFGIYPLLKWLQKMGRNHRNVVI